ncbi:MAG: lipoyl domain-containing protein [Acidobacteria bacterium]|nr:lipoyl domain-containing protein [Acidobacteriota bacterium]
MQNQLEIRVPKMGMDTTEVTLSAWLVQPGDEVKVGQSFVELESEKVTLALESEHAGRILELLQPVGATVPVGGVLCTLEPS